MKVKHILYETGDPDCPKEILDSNGEVALAMCKLCGKGEIELEKPCKFETDDVTNGVVVLTLFTEENDYVVRRIGLTEFLTKRDITVLNRIQGLIVENAKQIFRK